MTRHNRSLNNRLISAATIDRTERTNVNRNVSKPGAAGLPFG
jgi:hypothetical protein